MLKNFQENTPGKGSALAFLGTVLKEGGAVEESIRVYKVAGGIAGICKLRSQPYARVGAQGKVCRVPRGCKAYLANSAGKVGQAVNGVLVVTKFSAH